MTRQILNFLIDLFNFFNCFNHTSITSVRNKIFWFFKNYLKEMQCRIWLHKRNQKRQVTGFEPFVTNHYRYYNFVVIKYAVLMFYAIALQTSEW